MFMDVKTTRIAASILSSFSLKQMRHYDWGVLNGFLP